MTPYLQSCLHELQHCYIVQLTLNYTGYVVRLTYTYTYTLYVVRLTCFLRSLCQTGPPYRETCPVSTYSYKANMNTKTTESQNALVLRLRESLKVDFHSQRRFTSQVYLDLYTLECSVNFWRKALIHTPLKIVI